MLAGASHSVELLLRLDEKCKIDMSWYRNLSRSSSPLNVGKMVDLKVVSQLEPSASKSASWIFSWWSLARVPFIFCLTVVLLQPGAPRHLKHIIYYISRFTRSVALIVLGAGKIQPVSLRFQVPPKLFKNCFTWLCCWLLVANCRNHPVNDSLIGAECLFPALFPQCCSNVQTCCQCSPVVSSPCCLDRSSGMLSVHLDSLPILLASNCNVAFSAFRLAMNSAVMDGMLLKSQKSWGVLEFLIFSELRNKASGMFFNGGAFVWDESESGFESFLYESLKWCVQKVSCGIMWHLTISQEPKKTWCWRLVMERTFMSTGTAHACVCVVNWWKQLMGT